MAAIQDKGHITIDGYLFMLARQIRTERHIYGREEAPHFVNKFSSGDPNYRDSTFFPHFVQNNFLNGFDQEKFNDGGKYYRSSAVDPTTQEKLILQKKYSAAGQTTAGITVKCMESWRAAAASAFGDGSDGALTISTNTTDTPIDSACTGTQGSTTLSATNASFAAGQMILIHQSRGTGAGQWQKTKITGYSAGTITTLDPLSYTYVTGAQVIVMKQYTTVTVNVSCTWTAKAWNGTVGGILAFVSNGAVTVTGSINAAGQNASTSTGGAGIGFSGGTGYTSNSGAGGQGEGSAGAASRSTSANGNGGGGGSSNDGQGSGGGNGTAGEAGSTNAGTVGAAVGNASLTSMFFGGGGGGADEFNGSYYGGGGGGGGGIIFLFVSSITVTGTINANGGVGATGDDPGSPASANGASGAGGSVLIKCQTATLGTALVTATGGARVTAGDGRYGGAGGTGRVHVDYLTSVSGTTSPTLDSTADSSLSDTPAGSTYTQYVGASNGKIYTWDGVDTYTEVFDTRRMEWFDTTADTIDYVGDAGGTEYAQAQSFQLAANQIVKGVELQLYKGAGTPGAITVRIETNNAGVPSGTLAHANATTTIAAFTSATPTWYEAIFTTTFTLSASTLYWIVVKTAAAANDNRYDWTVKSTSGYASGNKAQSTDGGSTWAAQAGRDGYFRLLGEATEVNKILTTSVGGTKKMYFATGNPAGTQNGNARLYSWNGTAFALTKTFNTSNEYAILSMAEYGSTTTAVYLGLGGGAKIYSTTDFSTFTLKKTITDPDAGYVYSLKVYNQRLYAAGGYPEQINNVNSQYNGFLYSYDEFSWNKVSDFKHTVIKSMEEYDNLLFLGTIKRKFYVYNTASVDKLLELPYDLQITDMIKWEDKLAIATAPTPGTAVSGHEGIYLFDRNGFHNAFNVSSRSWHSLGLFSNNLMGGNDDGYVYQTSKDTYQASGTCQLSYFEASLPSIDKKWRSLILQYEALPTGCTILAEYKTDESDASWTTIGTASTVGGTSTEFTFDSAFYSKKLSIRLTLATTVPASTPTLKIVDMKYVLYPDFKYLWKMTLACPDNLIWLDGTEPISTTTAASISANATSLALSDASGFPTKGRAVLVDGSTQDEFTWTGKSGNTLTGIPSSGALALSAHSSTGYVVKMTGATMHHTILAMKQLKALNTFVDIDGTSYTVLFHGYQEDGFVVNQTGGLENHVPITLLET